MKIKKWTKDEESFIISHNHLSDNEIAEKLCRTRKSVEKKRYKLKLRKDTNRKWTNEDIEFLENNMDNMSYKIIGERLNRSEQSVKSKAHKLVSCGNSNYKSRPWTKEENDFLTENADIIATKEIALKLSRSYRSISQRLHRLNIKKNRVVSKRYNAISKKNISKKNMNDQELQLYKKIRYAWHAMKQRCIYKDHRDYSGIDMYCDWKVFKNFYDWAIENCDGSGCLTRIDKTLGYSPENCIFGDIDRSSVYYLNNPSSEELGLKNYVESFGYKFHSTWDLLKTHQIDLYNEELKLAFEYNGLWYHSEFYKRGKNYHFDKYLKCKELDICLIHIWSDWWKFDREYVESIVKFLFGRGEHPDVDKYDDCIPNGLGLELTEKFKNKKFVEYKNPDFFQIPKVSFGDKRVEKSSPGEHYKIWDAGYSMYK